MADKFIYVDYTSGLRKEKEALQSSAGVGDSGRIPALDGTGRLDVTMMPVGFHIETDQVLASENLAAGDFVNIYTNVGVANVRKADATTSGKEANGFVISSVTSGQTATVHRPSQSNTQRSGLVPGTRYFLATTAGSITATPPSASGNIIQFIGTAISATVLDFTPDQPIVLV